MRRSTQASTSGYAIGGATRFAILMAGIVGGIALLLALPAMGWAAKVNFGADLKEPGVSAVDSAVPCKWDADKPCTRLPHFYGDPSPVGGNTYAPHTGVIKKISLISEKKGSMRIQLGETFNQALPMGEVESNGPVIEFKGTGQIETFKVNIPVLKFDKVGFRTKRAKTLSCSQPGLESSFQFDPPLKPGAPLQVSSWQEECTHLIQARMVY